MSRDYKVGKKGKIDRLMALRGKMPLRGLDLRRSRKRRLGLLAGKMRIPANFDAPLPPKTRAAFEGR